MVKKTKKFKKLPKPPCPFNGNTSLIDYKDVYKLKKYITTRGRIMPSQRTGVSPACQRKLAVEIKKARYMALLPYNNLV
jgi:small subunit ribosomal protein S18